MRLRDEPVDPRREPVLRLAADFLAGALRLAVFRVPDREELRLEELDFLRLDLDEEAPRFLLPLEARLVLLRLDVPAEEPRLAAGRRVVERRDRPSSI